jgi:hypothetical protein
MPRGNQLTRQWQLLQLLDRPAGASVDDAARDLECTVRTIWRDLRVLERAGFPIYDEAQADGRRSVWKVEDSFRRQLPLKLSLAEVAALLMSRELPVPAGVLGSALASSFEKIGSVLSKDAFALPTACATPSVCVALGAKLQAPAGEHLAADPGRARPSPAPPTPLLLDEPRRGHRPSRDPYHLTPTRAASTSWATAISRGGSDLRRGAHP